MSKQKEPAAREAQKPGSLICGSSFRSLPDYPALSIFVPHSLQNFAPGAASA